VLYHPYLSLRYAVEGVVTVIDAVNGPATLDAHGEAVKQAAVAERLVIAKADLVANPAGRDALEARLRRLNPGAAILTADAPVQAIIAGGLFDLEGRISDVGEWLKTEAVEAAERASHAHQHGHHHHGHHGHDHRHDVNRHDARIRAFCLTSDRPIRQGALDMFLDFLRSSQGVKLLRVKGLVKPGIDRPDAAALSDNPLSLRR
jgi:G3E family GTPase